MPDEQCRGGVDRSPGSACPEPPSVSEPRRQHGFREDREVDMRRLGVALRAAIAMVAVIGIFCAMPATASQASSMPTVSAVSPTSGPVSGGTSGQPPITRETSFFPVTSETLGDNSIMINPVKVGDLVVLSMQLHT